MKSLDQMRELTWGVWKSSMDENNGLDDETNTKLWLLGWKIWWGPMSMKWRVTDGDNVLRHTLDSKFTDQSNPREVAHAVLHKV